MRLHSLDKCHRPITIRTCRKQLAWCPRARRETALLRRRRDDRWIAISALAAALLALPLAQSSWHGPEVSSVLAIAAIAMFAGQRWAIAVIVIAELLLLPTVWPRAFLASRYVHAVAAFGSVLAIIPGVLAMRRAAAALVLVTGWRRRARRAAAVTRCWSCSPRSRRYCRFSRSTPGGASRSGARSDAPRHLRTA